MSLWSSSGSDFLDVGVGVGAGGNEAEKFLGSTRVHDGSSFLWMV